MYPEAVELPQPIRPKSTKLLILGIIGILVLIVGVLIAMKLTSSSTGDGVAKASVEADFISNVIESSTKQISDYSDTTSNKSMGNAVGYAKLAFTKDGIDDTPLEVKRTTKNVDGGRDIKTVFKVCKKSDGKSCLYVYVASQWRSKYTTSDNKISDIVAFADKASAIKLL